MSITKTLRSRTKTGWVTKASEDIYANRLTAEEVDDNFLAVEEQIEDLDTLTETMYNPNILIDGNFEYWDEGSGPFTGIQSYTATMSLQHAQAVSVSRSTNVPNKNSLYSYEMERTNGVLILVKFVSSQQAKNLIGKKVTVSYWAQNVQNNTLTTCSIHPFSVKDTPDASYPLGDSDKSVIVKSVQYFAGTGWEFFSGSCSAVIPDDFENGFSFTLVVNGTSAELRKVRIAQVKLEPGTKATPFYQGPEERLRVLRYYWKSCAPNSILTDGVSEGRMFYYHMVGTHQNYGRRKGYFPVPMRTTPTMTVFSTSSGAAGKMRNMSTSTDIDGSFDYVDAAGYMARPTNAVNEVNDQISYQVQADARFYP